MKRNKIFYLLIIGIFLFPFNIVAESALQTRQNSNSPKIQTKPPVSSESTRRAKPAPFDSIFPSTEYLGPTIGVPNTDPIYPLNKWLWKGFPALERKNIRIYGWANPSYNASNAKNSNFPLTYLIVPDHLELQQAILRAERLPDTVQLEHIDWGFRFTNLYGIDYRLTTTQGYFSSQLLRHNKLYGYDLLEAFGQLYFPLVAEGMVITFGRYFSPPDIESQLAPQNYLVTHSLINTFDAYTQTGVNTAIKLNNTWTILLGIHASSDIAPWTNAATPTFQALVRWVSRSNNDSLWGGINSLNNGRFKGNHDNLQQFNLTWTHRFTKKFFTATEMYYIYQYDAAMGGTCNFGPRKSYGGGGGCGPIIPGRSHSVGIVNFIELKVSDKNFISFRTDFLDDYQGQRTGFATPYLSGTLGLTHQFSSFFIVRPEFRYDKAFRARSYDNGTRSNLKTFAVDAILKF